MIIALLITNQASSQAAKVLRQVVLGWGKAGDMFGSNHDSAKSYFYPGLSALCSRPATLDARQIPETSGASSISGFMTLGNATYSHTDSDAHPTLHNEHAQ